jgi:hypothetical protein
MTRDKKAACPPDKRDSRVSARVHARRLSVVAAEQGVQSMRLVERTLATMIIAAMVGAGSPAAQGPAPLTGQWTVESIGGMVTAPTER